MKSWNRVLGWASLGAWLLCSGCLDPNPPCKATVDCPAGLICVEQRCFAPSDGGADAGVDAGTGGAGGMGGGGGAGGMDAGADAGLDGGRDAGPTMDAGDVDGGADGGDEDGGVLLGESCEHPQQLTGPGTVSATTIGYHDDITFIETVRCQNGSPQDIGNVPDRVFALTIPAATKLDVLVVATPDAGDDGGTLDAIVNILTGVPVFCGDTLGHGECLVAGGDDPDSATYTNGSAGPEDVFIVVDGYGPAVIGPGSYSGAFTLTTTFTSVVPGDICEAATPFDAGTPLTGQATAGFNNNYINTGVGGLCRFGTGADRVYVTDVPAGSTLSVTATPSSTLDVMLSLAQDLVACAATRCVGGVDVGGSGQPDTIRWTNTTGVAKQVGVIVDAYDMSNGSFSLAATLSTPAQGDTCVNPFPVTASGSLTGRSTLNMNADYNRNNIMGCRGSTGQDVVYAVALAPSQQLTVTLTTMADGVINILPGPASNCSVMPAVACLASADANSTNGAPEVATYTNGSTAQTVLVLLSKYSDPATPMDYSVQFTLTP